MSLIPLATQPVRRHFPLYPRPNPRMPCWTFRSLDKNTNKTKQKEFRCRLTQTCPSSATLGSPPLFRRQSTWLQLALWSSRSIDKNKRQKENNDNSFRCRLVHFPRAKKIHVHALLKLRSLDKNEINRQRSKGRPSSSVVFLCRLAYADHLPSQLYLLFPQQSMLFGASYRALCHPKIMGGSAVSWLRSNSTCTVCIVLSQCHMLVRS